MHTKTFPKLLGNRFKLIVLLALLLPIFGNSFVFALQVPPGGGSANAQWSSYYDITLGSRVFVNDPTAPPFVDSSNNNYVMLYNGQSTATSCADAMMVPFDPTASSPQSALTAATTTQEVPGQLQTISLPHQKPTKECVWSYTNPLGYVVTLTNARPGAAVWVTQTPPTLLYNGVTYNNAVTTCVSVTNGCTPNVNDITLTDSSGGSCANTVEVNPYKTALTAILTSYSGPGGLAGCQNQTKTTINIAYGSYTAASPTTSPSNSSPNPCPITDAGALTWIFCPIYTVGVSAVKALSTVLESFLYVPNVFLTSFQGATNTFRDFGEALLVIAGLVMVVSQAAGLEIFAAYTVRKALPRIIIAAIGIALSGPILQFIVTFFNDLGTWSQALILNAVVPTSLGNNVSGVFTSVLGGTGVVLVSIAAIAASALVVLSMIGTLLLALFVGFLVLTIRQLVIVVCLIMAPLAIASYVLPGTDRIWQFWRKAFLSTMIMFPIIMSVLGAGLALSYLAGQLAKTQGAAWALMSILALVAPLFLLPFSFALAGGIMASVHGLVNGAHQGAFTRLSKFRQQKIAERVQDAKRGDFLNPTNKVATGVSSLAWGVTNASQAGANPRLWKQRMKEAKKVTSHDEAARLLEESAVIKANANDNDALKAAGWLAEGNSDATVRGKLDALAKGEGRTIDPDKMQSTMVRAKMMQEAGSNRAVKIATFMADTISGTGAMYDVENVLDENGKIVVDAKGNPVTKAVEGSAQRKFFDSLAEATQYDPTLSARVWGESRSALQRAGRQDIGGVSWSGGYNMGVAKAIKRDAKDPVQWKEMLLDSFVNNNANTILSGKVYSTEAIAKAVQSEMTHLHDSGQTDPKMQQQFAEFAAGMITAQRNGVYSSPEAVRVVNQTIASSAPEVRARIDQLAKEQRDVAIIPDAQRGAAPPPE